MELSRQKYEESLLVTNADAASELSESSSSSDDHESKTEEIPQIVVDPVEEGREVSIRNYSRQYNADYSQRCRPESCDVDLRFL